MYESLYENHKLARGRQNQVVGLFLAAHCNVNSLFFLTHARLILEGYEECPSNTSIPRPHLLCVLNKLCTEHLVTRPGACMHAHVRLSPLDDVEVVSVLALVDDVLLGLHLQLEHGVQHL